MVTGILGKVNVEWQQEMNQFYGTGQFNQIKGTKHKS